MNIEDTVSKTIDTGKFYYIESFGYERDLYGEYLYKLAEKAVNDRILAKKLKESAYEQGFSINFIEIINFDKDIKLSLMILDLLYEKMDEVRNILHLIEDYEEHLLLLKEIFNQQIVTYKEFLNYLLSARDYQRDKDIKTLLYKFGVDIDTVKSFIEDKDVRKHYPIALGIIEKYMNYVILNQV